MLKSAVQRVTHNQVALQPALQAVAIIDLGGQYCHMIGRRLRDIGVRSDVFPHDVTAESLARYSGIILSGGPQSVYDPTSASIDKRILDLGKPLLGICYGHQLLAQLLGCKVQPGRPEYGRATLELKQGGALFGTTPAHQTVWMSHGDAISQLPPKVVALAKTADCDVAAFAVPKQNIFGVQFHPEVGHTQYGGDLLRNFALDICGIVEKENIGDRVERLLEEIRDRVGKKSVLFFVSGGVDSTVAFSLCAQALPPERILGVYVDTGLMRKDETEGLVSLLGKAHLADRLIVRDERQRFLGELEGVSEPEEKRRIIGKCFIDVQRDVMQSFGVDHDHWLLGQGTIYPDTVESGGHNNTTALIKTHHNRCEEVRLLIAEGKVIEPLAEFYKDEVRQVGTQLGLGIELTERWPFPGPGLAIRVLCNAQAERPALPEKLDAPFADYEAAHLPIKTVGVQGDFRTYREVLAVRGPLNYDRLSALSTVRCNSDKKYNRVIAFVAGSGRPLVDGIIQPNKSLHAERIELLREADDVVKRIMHEECLMQTVWQFPTVMVPVSYSGGEIIVLRPVNSEDGMTATFGRLPVSVLQSIGQEICKLPGIDAVFVDITDKPPATIEWE